MRVRIRARKPLLRTLLILLLRWFSKIFLLPRSLKLLLSVSFTLFPLPSVLCFLSHYQISTANSKSSTVNCKLKTPPQTSTNNIPWALGRNTTYEIGWLDKKAVFTALWTKASFCDKACFENRTCREHQTSQKQNPLRSPRLNYTKSHNFRQKHFLSSAACYLRA